MYKYLMSFKCCNSTALFLYTTVLLYIAEMAVIKKMGWLHTQMFNEDHFEQMLCRYRTFLSVYKSSCSLFFGASHKEKSHIICKHSIVAKSVV